MTLKFVVAVLFSCAAASTSSATAEPIIARTVNKPERALQSDFADFCWKGTQLRDLGQLPTSCPDGMEIVGVACYPVCGDGYHRYGTDCHSSCPSDGVYMEFTTNCLGISWAKIPFLPFDIRFPMIDNHFKDIDHFLPTLMGCPDGKVLENFICYDPCSPGFEGFGSFCMTKAKSGWISCGMGNAVNLVRCGQILSRQVTSVTESVSFVASMSTTGIALTFSPAMLLDLINVLRNDHTKYFKIVEVLLRAELNPDPQVFFTDLANEIQASADNGEMTPVDVVRLVAELTRIFDPTGISNVVSAFAYDICTPPV